MNLINDPRRGSREAIACACGGLATLIASSMAFGQCGGGGDCFLTHGPGCNNVECCTAVCALDSFCCASSWDSVCVNEANDLCVTHAVAGPFTHPGNGNLYYILDPATWSSAQAVATQLGGHIVSIFDGDENQWLVSLMTSHGYASNFWIGLNDIELESVFEWEGGQDLSFQNWGPGQPDGGGPQDVVFIADPTGTWQDGFPWEVHQAIAEVEVYFCGDPDTGPCSMARTTPSCFDVDCCTAVCQMDPYCCNAEWDSFCADYAEWGCFSGIYAGPIVDPATGRLHSMSVWALWTYTQNYAAETEQSLITIRSDRENEFVWRTFGRSVPNLGATALWIGLNDLAQPEDWRWASGQPVTYTNWAPGNPGSGWFGGNVGMMQFNGQWDDVFGDEDPPGVLESAFIPACGHGGPFNQLHGPGCDQESCCNLICEIDPYCCSTYWDTSCVNEAVARCNPTIVVGPIVNPVTRHTYYGVTGALWSESERLANEMGGHLAVPNNAAENGWLTANFLNGSSGFVSAMIGIHDQLNEGFFQAVDVISPMPASFTAWDTGEPNNQGNEDMVHLLPSGKWNDLTRFAIQPAIIEIPCRGDLNGSGSVDAADLAILLGGWGPGSLVDLTFDAKVDASDLAILLGAWGPCASSTCCSDHLWTGCDQPGCTVCVCSMDPFCCDTRWDNLCAGEAADECNSACQCGG